MKRDPYKQGLNDGINRAKRVIKNDIKSIYGIMALIMIETGTRQKKQKTWLCRYNSGGMRLQGIK